MLTVTELRYTATNNYLIRGERGGLLFDTGWAGTFPLLCRALGEQGLRLQDANYLIVSHFHPDHMGAAQEIADAGVPLAAADVQREYLHTSDRIFEKEHDRSFRPIDDSAVRIVPLADSREFLGELGSVGELLHAPGHSPDSISLWLEEERALFVGDLAPLYELELHRGTETAETWQRLLAMKPRMIYYGHARPARLERGIFGRPKPADTDIYALVKRIMKLIDKGTAAEDIQQKTGASPEFITDVTRMYLTHPGVSVQGVLDRIEIKGK